MLLSMRKYVVSFISVALVGTIAYTAGRNSSSKSCESVLSELQQKIKVISEVDLAEYHQLKDRRLQAEKAEEILAKILQIFIADLGLRMAQADLGPSVKPIETTDDRDRTDVPNENARIDKRENSAKAPAPPPTEIDWKQLEERLPHIASTRDQDAFLKTVAQENFFPTVRGAKPASRAQLQVLAGTHKGQLVFLDKGRKSKDFELQIEFGPDLDKAVGNYSIIISQDGKPESHTRGSGDFSHFLTTGASAAIIIRSSPNSYIQLYYASSLGQFFGNSYNQDSIDKYVLEGHVYLR